MAKAILLLSGGLDSTLAGKLLMEMGVEVEAINFVSPFCQCTPTSLGCSAARRAAEQLDIPVHVFSCGSDYLDVVKHPRFGRGSGVNPCLDCRIHMFSRARAFMEERGADFVATGEVLGERPMSQRRQAIELIEREAGLEGLIVRPLSGGLLPASNAEREGLVRHTELMAISGRSRKPQFALARQLGIKDYLCPAGGCLLTDPEFAARFRDLLEHEPEFGVEDARLLRHGRHFRLPGGTKVVVGRHEEENDSIERAQREGDVALVPVGVTGPTVLCRGPRSEQDVRIAAGLLASYTKGGREISVEVRERPGVAEGRRLDHVQPIDRATADGWRIASARAQRVRG